MNDLNDLLARGNALQYFRANSPFPNFIGKILYHLEVDIGFQERHAHFAHSCFYVLFTDFTLAAQFLKNIL